MAKTFKEYDEEFKIVIVGSSSVGKSALIVRFVDDRFKDDLLATIGVDFRFRTLTVDGRKVKLQIWDTAGQESFRTIISAYYKSADAIILVYDLTEPATFRDINEFWLGEIEQNKEEGCQTMLIGNKGDLETSVKRPEAEFLEGVKKKLDTELYFETSAKTAESVEAAFVQLTKLLIQKRSKSRKAVQHGVTLRNSTA